MHLFGDQLQPGMFSVLFGDGATDEGDWYWSDGNPYKSTITNWGSGKPKEGGCVRILGGHGDWADIPCDTTSLNGFLCNRYQRQFNGNDIKIYRAFTSEDAEAFCNANYGTKLASLSASDFTCDSLGREQNDNYLVFRYVLFYI